MQLWGLTGGIASGKSTVASMLAAAGVPTLDADRTYHALLAPVRDQPSPLAAAVAGALGAELLGADGTLDRVALRGRAFAPGRAGREARARLEALTHPAIAAEVGRAARALAAAGHRRAVYDVPLLFERGGAWRLSGTLLVWVPVECQLARLIGREGLSEEEARGRLAAQLPLDAKRAWADWVLDNRGSRAATERQLSGWLRWSARAGRP